MAHFEPMQNKNWNQTPPQDDDDDMRSIMLERLSIVVAKGGLEMEEKLKYIYRGSNLRSCRFLWSSDPDHQLYKQKVAEYTKSPPPLTPPAPQNVQLVDPWVKLGRFGEQLSCSEASAFSVGIPRGMMRKEFGIIKFTALFVVRYGRVFRLALWDRVSTDTQFGFLKFMDKREDPCDVMLHFFGGLLCGYLHVMRAWENLPTDVEDVLEGFFSALNAFKEKQEDEKKDEVVDKVETDRRDFVVFDEYFVDIENKDFIHAGSSPLAFSPVPSQSYLAESQCLPPEPSSFRVEIPQGGMIMRKELGIMKFTAQFVVRYGNEFWDALWDKVCTKTEFLFLKNNPGNDTFFSQLLLAYGNVIQPWEIRPRKSDTARMEAVLERFFAAFDAFKENQEEEGDEVVDKAVTDRRNFLVSYEYFLDIEEFTPPPKMVGSSSMMEPWPKREKPTLISEEEFLAQHPGPSTITIHVLTGGRIIQITVESLSEKVASLKEKIAGEIKIPAYQQKLVGESGLLKDDMSLAHYNLGLGERLILLVY